MVQASGDIRAVGGETLCTQSLNTAQAPTVLRTGCGSCGSMGQWEHGESQHSKEEGARPSACTVSLYVYEGKNALGDKIEVQGRACQVDSQFPCRANHLPTVPSHPG